MDSFIGEIRLFGGNFAPVGWAFCNGQTMPIAQYDALFTLIGTTYGGDGQETFNLPDLQSRIPIHMGNGYVIGEQGGVESVTLTISQMPSHVHAISADASGNANNPNGKLWANWPGAQYQSLVNSPVPMSPQAVTGSGGNQPHDNMPPYLAVSFIICLEGVYPTQS